MDTFKILENSETEYNQLNKLYDECLNYLKAVKTAYTETFVTKIHEVNGEIKINNKNLIQDDDNSDYDDIEIPEPQNGETKPEIEDETSEPITFEAKITDFKVENEIESKEESVKVENGIPEVISEEVKSERLRKLSLQLPKIIITQSNTASNASLNIHKEELIGLRKVNSPRADNRKYISASSNISSNPSIRYRPGYGDYPKRLISKNGMENVALISNIPYERIRMLNDTFHTLINVRWRWIVWGTICVHFAIWLVFAVFWYITAMAHYDFEPDPPKKTCVTGGNDFLTIFLASVEAQTTIGFGDRTIDEECPESIFLFIMQLILGTGLSGVLTCVVYAKLTRPEKLSRDGVGFSKKAVISMRDGKLCLMIRTWDLNHDHIIGSEFNAHFVKTHRTKEGEVIRYYARSLELQQRQFLLWPVTLVHVIDETSPLFHMTPQDFANFSYEITLSLKGASASMGTFTQSQTSYLPKEIVWGYRFPPVVKYDRHKQKYAIEDKKLDLLEPVEMPMCSASQLYSVDDKSNPGRSSRSSFNERISGFHLQRSSSFRKNESKA